MKDDDELGLPAEWMHGADELYVRMRGTTDNLTVLATAFSPGAKQHEPVVWCTTFGKGRVVTISMGPYQRVKGTRKVQPGGLLHGPHARAA